MGRKKNKKKNAEVGTVSATFLKRDSDVGLFMLKTKQKLRVHKSQIDYNLAGIDKGAKFTIPKSMITSDRLVESRRMKVSNLLKNETEKVNNSRKTHRYSNSLMVINDGEDADFYKIPVGTKYYWLGLDDIPILGDVVMVSDWREDNHTIVKITNVNVDSEKVFGKVLATNAQKELGMIYKWFRMSDVGFVILNPKDIMYIDTK
jgi:hypothetical protein